jgi:uncharacterized membrane protein
MSEDPSAPPPVASRESVSPVPIAEGTGLPRNVAAALAVMIPLVGGLVFLVLEKRDRLVRFYSIQSIVLGALIAVALVIRMLIVWIFAPVPLLGDALVHVVNFVYGLFALAWLVVYLIALAMAFRSREWAIPYLGAVGRRRKSNGD